MGEELKVRVIKKVFRIGSLHEFFETLFFGLANRANIRGAFSSA
jgi:hypothetical protein